jgi:hypothetical protein
LVIESALTTGNTTGVRAAIEKVNQNAVARHIATLVSSSENKRVELAAMASQYGAVSEILLGLVVTAAGGALWTGAASIAAAIGVAATGALASAITAIGFVLIVIGVLMVGTQLYRKLKQEVSGFIKSYSEF